MLKNHVLDLIEKSGSAGLFFEEIQEGSKIKTGKLKVILHRLMKE